MNVVTRCRVERAGMGTSRSRAAYDRNRDRRATSSPPTRFRYHREVLPRRTLVPRVHRSDGNFEAPDGCEGLEIPAPWLTLTRVLTVVTCIDSSESMHC